MNKQSTLSLAKKPIIKNSLLIAVLGIVGFSIVWAIVAFATPLLIGDGSEDYAGAKQQLAKKAISDLSYMIDSKLRWSHVYHIENVRPTTTDEVEKSCTPYGGEPSGDSNNPRYYTVVLTESRLFGIDKQTVIIDGCNAYGPNQDGPYHKR